LGRHAPSAWHTGHARNRDDLVWVNVHKAGKREPPGVPKPSSLAPVARISGPDTKAHSAQVQPPRPQISAKMFNPTRQFRYFARPKT
jgi:hypothetical protein